VFNLLEILAGEGHSSREHLKEQHSERPPVHLKAVCFIGIHHLRGHIVVSATYRLGGLVYVLVAACFAHATECLGEPEVHEANVTISAEQHILWLDIAMDHAQAVEVLQGKDQLCNIELRFVLSERALLLEKVE
jgi:hypothetical protein